MDINSTKKEEKPKKIMWENPFIIAIVPAILALAGAIVVAYLAYWGTLNSQIKTSDRQQRQQAFSKLMGKKFMLNQLYVSRFEALIYSDYHEALWKLNGVPKDSLDFQEAQRWMRKSEDMALDIAKNNQELFEVIGSIRILFPKTSKLDELINRIYNFKSPMIQRDPFKMNPEQLENWKVKAVKDLQSLVETEYGKSMDDLLDYLSGEIDKLN